MVQKRIFTQQQMIIPSRLDTKLFILYILLLPFRCPRVRNRGEGKQSNKLDNLKKKSRLSSLLPCRQKLNREKTNKPSPSPRPSVSPWEAYQYRAPTADSVSFFSLYILGKKSTTTGICVSILGGSVSEEIRFHLRNSPIRGSVPLEEQSYYSIRGSVPFE
jgi:hypothetical protein